MKQESQKKPFFKNIIIHKQYGKTMINAGFLEWGS